MLVILLVYKRVHSANAAEAPPATPALRAQRAWRVLPLPGHRFHIDTGLCRCRQDGPRVEIQTVKALKLWKRLEGWSCSNKLVNYYTVRISYSAIKPVWTDCFVPQCLHASTNVCTYLCSREYSRILGHNVCVQEHIFRCKPAIYSSSCAYILFTSMW